MCVFETSTSIIWTGLPILVELINLVDCYNLISNDLTQTVNFPTRIPDCDSHRFIILFWIYFFLLTLVFVLKWLSSIVKFWSCCCLSFHWLSAKLKMGCPISLHWLFLCWLGQSSWSLRDVPREDILISVLLLLLVNFVSGFRLELMHTLLIISIRSNLAYLHGFQLLVLLSYFREITFLFVSTE